MVPYLNPLVGEDDPIYDPLSAPQFQQAAEPPRAMTGGPGGNQPWDDFPVGGPQRTSWPTPPSSLGPARPIKPPSSGGGGGFQFFNPFEGLNPFDFPDFVPPGFEPPPLPRFPQFDYPEFVAPSRENFEASPGYQFRLDEGQRAIQNAASARGLLRSGNTWKSLLDYAQAAAGQEYGNVYNRRFGEWQANRAAEASDYDRQIRNMLTSYGLGYQREMDEFTRALQTYGVNLGRASTAYGFELDRLGGVQGGNQNFFNNLLSLYMLATQNLPTYTPVSFSQYGF